MASTQEACAALIAEGQKINAIKRWRTDTGCSLKEAKAIIEHFEERGVWITPSDLPPEVMISVESIATESANPTMSITELQIECAHLLNNKEKIAAIKLWRQQTDCSLKEAKVIMEHFEASGSWSIETSPTEANIVQEHPPSTKNSSNLVWWILATGIVCYQMMQWFG